MNASKQFTLIWDLVTSYTKGEYQPKSSLNEKNMAIDLCTSEIDSYTELSPIF